MAFSKFANAVVQKPRVGLSEWNDYRRQSLLAKGTQFTNRSSSISIGNYKPDRYLLTHCTIIASVDTDEPPNTKTGAEVAAADGTTINRPHADYLIHPDCSKYINQNGDAWERKLLLSTYSTFIGAENYVEHIQIPELSKGKIIDAVARDLGDTVYVDILVATDRKHKDLVAKIESDELNTLSMGCTISFSICTKCGNKAIDEPDLCRHVKYEKGNKFVGPNGKIRVVAELCGHHTDPESVKFIEASWVANPAFKGAVMRNILHMGGPETKTPTPYEHDALQGLIHDAHIEASGRSSDWTDFIKTASAQITREVRRDLRLGFGGGGFDDEEEDKAPEPDKGMIDEVMEKLKDKAKSQLLDELKKEMEEPEPEPKDMPEAESAPNDTIHHSHKKAYWQFASRYAHELGPRTQNTWKILTAITKPQVFRRHKKRFSNSEIVTAMYLYDRDGKSETYSPDFYRCLSKVGGTHRYGSYRDFLRMCMRVAGRRLTAAEAKELINRAKLLN